jgi:hypothetical protein
VKQDFTEQILSGFRIQNQLTILAHLPYSQNSSLNIPLSPFPSWDTNLPIYACAVQVPFTNLSFYRGDP